MCEVYPSLPATFTLLWETQQQAGQKVRLITCEEGGEATTES